MRSVNVTIMSFGFKYGIPSNADFVFDVRFLPNPFYVDALRRQTGLDAAVQAYVMQDETASEFLGRLVELIRFLMEQYSVKGKQEMVVAIGCTGGRHRSVTLAGALYAALAAEAGRAGISVEHRDIRNDEEGS